MGLREAVCFRSRSSPSPPRVAAIPRKRVSSSVTRSAFRCRGQPRLHSAESPFECGLDGKGADGRVPMELDLRNLLRH